MGLLEPAMDPGRKYMGLLEPAWTQGENIWDYWSQLGPREQIYGIVGASLDLGSKYMELLEPAWTQGANILDYWSQLCTKGENPKYVNEGECKMEGKKKYKIELMDE